MTSTTKTPPQSELPHITAVFVCDDALQVTSARDDQGITSVEEVLSEQSLVAFGEAVRALEHAQVVTLALTGAHVFTYRKLWCLERTTRGVAVFILPAPTRAPSQRARYTDYASKMSHDLRSPIRKVTTFAQLLGRKLGLDDASKEAKYLRTILENADQAQHVTEAFIAYTDIVSGADVRPKAVALSKLLELSLKTARHRPETIDTLALPDVNVHVDLDFMSAALGAIVSNAVCFCPPGVPSQLTISAQVQGDCVTMSFEDNGQGVSADQLVAVFEPFYKTPSPRKIPTHGLGLAYAKEVLRAHGASIWIDPEPESGATVWVSLPYEEMR